MVQSLSRRSLLRGMLYGSVTSVALPILDQFLNNNGTAFADGSALPVRFVLLFWGDGTRINQWLPTKTGPGFALSPVLSPYAPVKDYVSLVSGTQCKIGGYVHHWGCAGMLSGSPYLASGTGTITTFSAPSFDQTVAASLGTTTRYKSLELGVLTPTKASEGTTLQYLSHNGPNDVNPPQTSPSALFTRMFGKSTLSVNYGSVLDTVLADLNALRSQVGQSDKLRLDAYTTQVRALETNLQTGIAGSCTSPPDPGVDDDSLLTGAAITQRSNTMWSLVTAALACDLTRVVSVQYCGPSDCIQVPTDIFAGTPLYEGGAQPLTNDLTHGMTHNESTTNQPVVTTWSTFYQTQFSNFLQKMVATQDGTGNLLDNSLVMITSEVSQGHNHSSLHMPMLLAGRAGGKLVHPGIHFAANAPAGTGASVADTPANTYDAFGDITTDSSNFANSSNAHLTALHALGIPAPSYGTSGGLTTTPIPELLA